MRNKQSDAFDLFIDEMIQTTGKYELPAEEIDQPSAVYRYIHDELQLNSNPSLNFATFVNVWMEDEAKKLALESLNINLADHSIYTVTTEIQKRIVHMVAGMLNADFMPGMDGYIGSATVGSSEAVMLGMLAHKTRWFSWYDSLPAERRPKDGRIPNMVMGGAYQVCWEKVYKFFDIAGLGRHGEDPHAQAGVENYDPEQPARDRCRIIPVEGERRVVTAQYVRDCIACGLIDDNTIALSLILGTTQTGEMDEIIEINEVMREFNDRREAEAAQRGEAAYRIPIHVDAAYGGFVLPFTESEIEWDFRASEVQSINVSNHKFGFVYPGLGTIIFRDSTVVPDSLFSKINYLGGEFNDYGLNFSRSSWPVICQYYNFLRFGKSGYQKMMLAIMETANYLAEHLVGNFGYNQYFELLSDTIEPIRQDRSMMLRFPNLVLKVKPDAPFTAVELSAELQKDGWTVPAYTLPAKLEHISVLRLVIKENTNRNMASHFVRSIDKAIQRLVE